MLRTIDAVRVTKIKRVVQESSNIRSLIFDDLFSLSARAGQFAMIWLPDVGEFPMSISLNYGEKSSIVVKAMGEGSRALFNSREDDLIGIRGPYGTRFEIPESARKALLVGGGTGIAPIVKLAEEISKSRKSLDATVVVAARTKDELPFLETLKELLGEENVYPTTDDGSLGFRGFAHEKVRDVVEKQDIDMIYCCGPEAMMIQVFRIASDKKIRSQFSLERIMKCGIAICGSCCIEDVVLCRDGPVLDHETLKGLSSEFGKFERDRSGAIVGKS